MGEKGAKLTLDAATFAEASAARLESLGNVTRRKMFGGLGIFESGKMFAIVNSKAELSLKADDEKR